MKTNSDAKLAHLFQRPVSSLIVGERLQVVDEAGQGGVSPEQRHGRAHYLAHHRRLCRLVRVINILIDPLQLGAHRVLAGVADGGGDVVPELGDQPDLLLGGEVCAGHPGPQAAWARRSTCTLCNVHRAKPHLRLQQLLLVLGLDSLRAGQGHYPPDPLDTHDPMSLLHLPPRSLGTCPRSRSCS